MKEVTTEITIKLMFHEKVKDQDVDEYISHDQDPEIQRQFAAALADMAGADKGDLVGKVKVFVMDDVAEEPSFDAPVEFEGCMNPPENDEEGVNENNEL